MYLANSPGWWFWSPMSDRRVSAGATGVSVRAVLSAPVHISPAGLMWVRSAIAGELKHRLFSHRMTRSLSSNRKKKTYHHHENHVNWRHQLLVPYLWRAEEELYSTPSCGIPKQFCNCIDPTSILLDLWFDWCLMKNRYFFFLLSWSHFAFVCSQ